MQQVGLRACSFDKYTVRGSVDLLTDDGFAIALMCVLCLVPGSGLLWMAPVCSSWVYLNRATSQRSPLGIYGNTKLGYVRDANLMVSRCALLIWIARTRGLHWVLEQPSSSIMLYHPRLQELARSLRVLKVRVCLGAFNSKSLKPVYLLTT